MTSPPAPAASSTPTTSPAAKHQSASAAGTKRPRAVMEQVQDTKTPAKEAGGAGSNDGGNDDDGDGDGGWQTIRNGRPTKKLKKVPKKESGNYPAFSVHKSARLQSRIQVSDLRNLVTYIFADGTAPQWLAVHHRPHFRKIVAVLVPGLEEAMFKPGVDYARWTADEDGSVAAVQRWVKTVAAPFDDAAPRPLDRARVPRALRPLADVFEQMWPVRARGNEKYGTLFSPMATFLTAPLPKSAGAAAAAPAHKDVRTRITEFIASPEQYLANEFVLHPAMLPTAEQRAAFRDEPGWVHTAVDALADGDVPEAEIEQGSITAGRAVYAVDCEMCLAAGNRFVLTRISVVGWDGEVVMDELVRPDEPIVDYLTQYSGITEAMLAPVTTRLCDIQARLLALLDARAVLVGHSLDSDVKAMQLTHPFVVDTSIAFPHPLAPVKKHALRWLANKYLHREIQRGHGTARGHDSVEDARTCLDLIKRKCEKGKAWAAGSGGLDGEAGGGEGAGESLFRRLERAGIAYRNQGGPRATGGMPVGKTTAAADWGDARHTLAGNAQIVLGGCHSDADVEAAVLRAVRGDPDGREVPGGGADFVFARMRELEALQGWWNRNKLGDAVQGPPSRETLEALIAAEEEKYPDDDNEDGNDTPSLLERGLRVLARRLRRIHVALPPCTALVVFSGSGDPRAMSRLQAQRAQHKKEYHTPGVKWDDISVPWTDTEAQQLQQAVRRAREGIAFLTVK